MCYDVDAHPPLPPIRGAALDAGDLTLISADGTPVAAYGARAAQPGGAGIAVLPDVRGLHPFYEELALRFAEAGVQAIAIDYFSRTAGTGRRGADFDYMPHVSQARHARNARHSRFRIVDDQWHTHQLECFQSISGRLQSRSIQLQTGRSR